MSSSDDTVKVDDLPPAIRDHPELARLLRSTEHTPEVHRALTKFLRACGHLTPKQLAEVFGRGERLLRELYPLSF